MNVHRMLVSRFICIAVITHLMTFVMFLNPRETALAAYDDDLGFKTAADLLNQGRYLESLSAYQEISEYSEVPENQAKALLYMGTIYSLFLDQFDTALRQYDRVLRKYPESLAAQDALFNSGTVLYESGKYRKAYECFSGYLKQYPDGLRQQSAEIWAGSAEKRFGEEKETIPLKPVTRITDTTLRVLVTDQAPEIVFQSDSPLSITEAFTHKKIHSGSGHAVFSKRDGDAALNGKPVDFSSCRVETRDMTMLLNGKRFRGIFIITDSPEGFQAVNHVSLEAYLYGVVPREMSPGWPKQTLMAQAVASRTYALYIQSKSKDKAFDVVSTTASQVYGGFDVEAPTANMAVDETRGQVITHRGKLIVAYFHSNSGGYTEDSKYVWMADLPYLKGVPDRYSEHTPASSWEYELTYKDLRDQLNRYGMNIGVVRKLEPLGKSPSGRMLNVRVISDNGTYELRSNAFRIKTGATRLKSTLLDLEYDGQKVHIRGKGYGHGVGMSQWGARQMALQGFEYRDILKHYYKEVDIVSISSF